MAHVTPPADIDQGDFVAYTLRMCALQVDPRYGRFTVLAQHLDMHESTFNLWVKKERVPRKACRQLLRKFGKKLIDVNRLTGEA